MNDFSAYIKSLIPFCVYVFSAGGSGLF